MYNPWRTVKILEVLPDIYLTADFAHWMPVLDGIPRDLEDMFAYCCERPGHLHARVGSEKSPQVPDPRDPLWQEHLMVYESWWDKIVNATEERGESLVITAEFGLWPYLVKQLFSGEPIADVNEIVAWTIQRLRKRYRRKGDQDAVN